MVIRTMGILVAALTLGGCAGPKWQHTEIVDKSAADRQLVIDDGYCTLVATGSAPMPQVQMVQGPTTSNVTLQGRTQNVQTGATSYGSYTGQVTTTPAGGFAGGFASGMANGANLGAAIAAGQAQERIHKACMFAKGWSDGAPAGPAPRRVPATAVQSTPNIAMAGQAVSSDIYKTPAAEWGADVQEFLRFFPKYANGPLYNRLDEQVKIIARAQPALNGPQILVAADKALSTTVPNTAESDGSAYDTMRSTYFRAIDGSTSDQAGLGLSYAKGDGPLIPVNPTRSAFWSRKAAVAGNFVGQMGYGIVLFSGIGVQQDKVNGYLWVKKASRSYPKAVEILQDFEREMSVNELRAVK